MFTPESRVEFQNWATGLDLPLDTSPTLAAAALMAHAAFIEPERQIAIFDTLANAWLDHEPDQRGAILANQLAFLGAQRNAGGRQAPQTLWDAFWKVMEFDPETAGNAVNFTLKIVAIGMAYDEDLLARCERAVLLHDDVHNLIKIPEHRITTADLLDCPKGSLGNNLHTLLVTNGYDLEVIDPDTVLLDLKYVGQNRTNRRILLLHDIWHLVAGYGFTGTGEVAISGFQLAQFGQNYSTRFLAVTTTIMAYTRLIDPDKYITLIAEGWRHGRETGPLLSKPWEVLVNQPIADVRHELGIRAFASQVEAGMEIPVV
jgi:ubiquinone biosynthesis protein Coq4